MLKYIPTVGEFKEAGYIVFSSPVFQICLLLSASVITHFFNLSEPQSIVFDEKYFVPIAHSYQEGTFFIDPHPPLGKLILTTGVDFAGNHGPLSKEYIEKEGYPGGYNITAIRLLPALFSIALSGIMYLIILHITKVKSLAMIAGLMTTFENAHIVQGTYLLFDSILLFFIFTSLLFGLYMVAARGRKKYLWLVFSALFAGAAFSTKVTGFSALGLLLLLVLRWDQVPKSLFSRLKIISTIGRGLIVCIVSFSVLLGSYAVHFSLINKTGDGVHEYSKQYQQSLQSQDGEASRSSVSFWHKLTEEYKASVRYENGVPPLNMCKECTGEGEIGSHPSTWPLMGRVIAYYWRREADDHSSYSFITFIGNPVVWYAGLAGIIVTLSLIIAGIFINRQLVQWETAFILFGYLLNYVPLFFITRVMYLYHYLIPLMFSVLLFCMIIHTYFVLSKDYEKSNRVKWFFTNRYAVLLPVIIFLTIVGYALYAPFTYALPVSKEYFDAVNIFPVWDLKWLIIE